MDSVTKMQFLLGVILISFTVVRANQTEIFPVPDVMKILTSDTQTGVSETCGEHMNEYLLGIVGRKPWALQMVDSVTKFPDGIMVGHFVIPGIFDECVDSANEHFTGKHCMTKLRFKNGPEIIPKLEMSYGICMPSTCNSSDIENAIKSVEELGFLQVNVSETECSTKEFRPFRTEDWVTVGLLTVLAIIALGSTAYDLLQRAIKKSGKYSA